MKRTTRDRGSGVPQAQEGLKVSDCLMQHRTANPALVVCHFPTKINKTCPYSVCAIFHNALNSAGDSLGEGTETALLMGLQYTIVTGGDSFQKPSLYQRI